MKKLTVTNPALYDLQEIWNFIANDNVEAADRVEVELKTAMNELCETPWLGHPRHDIKNQTIRFWSVHSYLIAYRVEGDRLFVWRVIHGARNLARLFPKRN